MDDTHHSDSLRLLQQHEFLRTSKEQLDLALEAAAMGIWDCDIATGRVAWAGEHAALFGIPLEAYGGTLDHVQECVHPDDRERGMENLRRTIETGVPFDNTYRVVWPDGSVHWLHSYGKLIRDAKGQPARIIGITHNITARKLAEERLQLAASVFTHAREGILIATPEEGIIDVNTAFTEISGYGRDAVLGQSPTLLYADLVSTSERTAMWEALLDRGHWSGEVWHRHARGECYLAMQTLSAVLDDRGVMRRYVILFSDITALKEHERRKIERLAHYDPLTALPNRTLLVKRLQQAMAQARRGDRQLAVAYLDLDGFKSINDGYGHEIGDLVLMGIAARLKLCLRQGDTLARLGGDEFVAVMQDLEDREASVPILARLLDAAADAVRVGDRVFRLSASLGVTFYPQGDDTDADHLLRQSDQAMYQAKLAGRNCYHLFDAERDRTVRGHYESLERIRRGLADREFVLYYQPKVNLRTGEVIGAEALIRWQHPERGLLAPAVFLPVVEDHPLAVDMGDWVIDAALAQMDAWLTAGLRIPVSVNVGARQLQQSDFVAKLRASLREHARVAPGDLGLEILETSALRDLVHVSATIAACQDLGVRCALDDFGTGYSSLTYLRRLPIALIKIDQSFVRDMLDDPEDLAIVESVMGLASTLHRHAIAEGVETCAHGELLLQLGCELAQGYGIARPMPAAAMPDWIARWRPDARWSGLAPVCREDVPLLYAAVEHRRWIADVERYLKGEIQTPPILDHRECRFGVWLQGLPEAADETLVQLQERHRQIHILAKTLIDICRQGHGYEALGHLQALGSARDELVERLRVLIEERQGARGLTGP